MKKVLLIAFILSFFVSARGQVDTFSIVNASGQKVGSFTQAKAKPDTVRIVIRDTVKIVVRDTIRVNYCDTAKKEFRGLYVGSEFATIIGNASREDSLKRYVRDYGYNLVSVYGLSNIASSRWNQLRAFVKDVRKNYGVEIFEATGGSSSVFSGSRSQYNAVCIDSLERFNRFNMEREYWNAKDSSGKITDAAVLSEWKKDSVQMSDSHRAAKNSKASFTWYHGWPVKFWLPIHLVKNQDVLLFHCYRTSPDSNYMISRLRALDSAQYAIDPNVKKDLIVLVSAESAFMQNYFRTNSLKSVEDYFRPFVNRFRNLRFAGIQVFMYSEMAKAQPHKGSAARIASSIPEKESSTSKSHIETAIER